MKVKTHILQRYMQDKKLTVQSFAQAMGMSTSELKKLLDGDAVGEKTAQIFIDYFGAHEAQEFIDWQAIGKQNPFVNSGV